MQHINLVLWKMFHIACYLEEDWAGSLVKLERLFSKNLDFPSMTFLYPLYVSTHTNKHCSIKQVLSWSLLINLRLTFNELNSARQAVAEPTLTLSVGHEVSHW